MNVAEMLLTGRVNHHGLDPELAQHFQAAVANHPCIEIQNIVEAFPLLEKDWFPTTVSVAPPWWNVTLFFSLHNLKVALISQACRVSASTRESLAIRVKADVGTTLDVEKALEPWTSGFAIRNFVFVSWVGQPRANYLGRLYQFLDDDGFPVKRGMASVSPGLLWNPLGEQLPMHLVNQLLLSMSTYQLLAFSFCHCKNVGLVSAPVSRQVRRNAQRHNQPVFEHHNIVIDPIRRVLNNSGGFSQHGDVLKAMHICRGHFARYGEQYGTGKLFGKHEGTFWVSQHVRGKLERGVVTKDYALKAGAGK